MEKKKYYLKTNIFGKVSLLTFCFITLLFCRCSDDNKNDGDENDGNDIKKIGFIMSQKIDEPYIFTCIEDESMVVFNKNIENGNIKSGVFLINGNVLFIRYSDDGLPATVSCNNYFGVFSDYSDGAVKLTVYNSEHEEIINTSINDLMISELLEKIEVNKRMISLRSDYDEVFNEADRLLLKTATLGMSVVSCIISTAVPALAVISCSSTILSHIDYFLETVDPNYDKEGFIHQATVFVNKLDCFAGLAGLFTNSTNFTTIMGAATTEISCITAFSDLLFGKEQEIIDDFSIELDREKINYSMDIKDYVKITTEITGLTNNSATITGRIIFKSATLPSNYTITNSGATWGVAGFNHEELTYKTDHIFNITLTNLEPNVDYIIKTFYTFINSYRNNHEALYSDIDVFTTLDDIYNEEGFFAGTLFYKTAWKMNLDIKEVYINRSREAKYVNGEIVSYYIDYTKEEFYGNDQYNIYFHGNQLDYTVEAGKATMYIINNQLYLNNNGQYIPVDPDGIPTYINIVSKNKLAITKHDTETFENYKKVFNDLVLLTIQNTSKLTGYEDYHYNYSYTGIVYPDFIGLLEYDVKSDITIDGDSIFFDKQNINLKTLNYNESQALMKRLFKSLSSYQIKK